MIRWSAVHVSLCSCDWGERQECWWPHKKERQECQGRKEGESVLMLAISPHM